jgi:hypothetical protein
MISLVAALLLASSPGYVRPAVPNNCAAIRGNGELVMSHFTSLARLVEDQGVIDGLAGGSSASISMFIYESMLANPAVWGGKPEESALRLSFLLKSMQEYVDIVAGTDEMKALTGLGQQLISDAQSGALLKTLQGPPDQAVKALGQVKAAVQAAGAGALLNKDALAFLDLPGSPQQRVFRANELVLALKTFGKFEASDKLIFFRPGLIDFKEVALRIAKVGSVYAGQGADAAAWKKLLDRCAPGTKGKRWAEIKAANASCTSEAHGLIASARAKNPTGRGSAAVGSVAHVLVATSVLESAERKLWEDGLKRYTGGDNLAKFDFHPFPHLKIGYFGAGDDLAKVKSNPKGFGDAKTAKRLALGSTSWATAISLSPAEPGLSRGNPIPGSSNLSLGGWPDLAPVLALKNLGCKEVFYVTRQGDESPFAQGVAKNLGMTDAQQKQFYDLATGSSAFATSLKQADAVHCTNWNAFKANQREPMDVDAFNAPLFTRNADLAKHHAGASASGGGPVGCTK